MRLWRTLLFAAIAAGLGAYLWFVERPRMQAESRPERLMAFDPDEIQRIRLTYPGQTLTLALDESGDWRIQEPLEADADDGVVERLLKQIADAEAERRIPAAEAQALATYGLEGDGTQARISLTEKDGTALPDLVVGDSTPVGFQAFARIEGKDEVVVVPLIVHSGVKKSVFDVREKSLFDLDPEAAVSAKLVRPDGAITLEREEQGWKITAPIEDGADAGQVSTLLRSLNEIDALAFYDDAEADRGKFGLEAPTVAFEAELRDRGAAGLRIGAKSSEAPDGWYAERIGDGLVVKVPEWVKVRFDQPLAALRDKRLFTCEAHDLAKIRYERRDGESFTLLREGDAWRMEPAPERELDVKVVERTASGLASLAGTEIVAEDAEGAEELARFGLDAPVAEVELLREDGSSCGRAQASAVAADSDTPEYYVRRGAEGPVMSVPAYLYSRFDLRAADFLGEETPAQESPPEGGGSAD